MKYMLDRLLYLISCAFLFKLIFGFGDAISPSGLPQVHLRFKNGTCMCIFGQLPAWAIGQIGETLETAGVTKAVIKRMKNGSFRFSRSVPDNLRQRLRNMLLAR